MDCYRELVIPIKHAQTSDCGELYRKGFQDTYCETYQCRPKDLVKNFTNDANKQIEFTKQYAIPPVICDRSSDHNVLVFGTPAVLKMHPMIAFSFVSQIFSGHSLILDFEVPPF
jgi:hypothetical protein